ncbi:DEAD/DEAH box helicase family protein, partial [Faecalibacterium prausnitzii]
DHYPDHQKITLKWAQVEKYIDLMIQSDRYLTDKEKEHYTPPAPVSVKPDATLTHAKNLIRDFCLEEYDSEPDFSNLSKIGIAYTNATDEEIPIQVNVDLVGYRVERYLGEVLIDERQYESLEDLTETELEALDFSELVSVTDEELEHYHNEAEEHPALLPLDAANEYNALKEQHPDALVGFEQGGQFEFYGEDARKVCELLGGKLLEKETALGIVPVTGFPSDQWVYRAKQLWQCGENIYLAGLNEDGTHHQTKYLRREDYLPLGTTIHMEGRAFRVDTVNYDRGSVTLQDVALAEMRMPVFREEPLALVRELYEQEQDVMEHPLPDYKVGDNVIVDLPTRTIEGTIGYVGETDVRIDTSAQGQSWDNEVINKRQFEDGLRQNEQVTTQPDDTVKTVAIYSAEENRMPYDIVIQTIGSKSPALDAVEPERSTLELAGNFHITDDDLGIGGPKQKYARNIEAIRTLFQLEQEHRGATAEEQQVLSQYVGWGGLADAFDPGKDNWAKEYAELKGLLSEDEYAAARSSTLNAHYTSPTVIRSIYDAVERMGFRSGNILEPSMGVGNFFGMLPDSMAGSRLYGVELDSITGRIAQKLYPQADITVAGFETTDRRDFYDLAVGNVPFGQYKVNDKAYNKLGFSIHNYFFAKAIDQVRPGGIVAFVTSRYTMDSKDSTARKHMAERADLLGAIRLPNNAFRANAGTDVVSDIIFLQKRDRPIDHEPDWVQLGKTEDGFAINQYFVDHPEMILGVLSTESTQYGREELTVAPIEGANLADQLAEAVQHIEGQYTEVEVETPDIADAENEKHILPADPDVKNFSYTVVDGEVFYRENSVMTQVELPDTAKGRVTGMVELRQIVNDLIQQQLEDYPDADIKATQERLNAAYDAFTAKYGLLNDRKNGRLFEQDSSYYLLCSLENLDEQGQLKSKAAMFTKRTIRPERTVTSVDTPSEALAVSIGEHGKVDLPYMAELLGTPGDYGRITTELSGVIFKDPAADPTDPEVGWQMADEYLSGNVRDKLRMAQFAAETNPEFAVNVDALTKAQPRELEASEIDVRLGATWLSPDIIQKFMTETFQIPYYLRHAVKVRYSPYTAEWRVEGKTATGRGDIISSETYGTSRANAYKILEETLNLKDVRIYDTIEDAEGKPKRVLNKRETMLAQQKQQVIKDAFANWVWQDPQRRIALVKQYNELFNSTRPREYDGSHIHFVGMNPEITLREHQRNAIAHVLYGGNTLLAHEVGAGKTYEMAASAMEAKRLGLCQKSLFVVPNHLTEQWASEFLRLYPNAKLLVTSKKDFEPGNRKKFCARIATGDYDAVIIGHSQFEKIPLSAERQERLI